MAAAHDLCSGFAGHLKKRFPFLRGQRVLLAVSGGLDSMAMLNLFLETEKKTGITPVVAHIDHNLRTDSGRDAHFVDKFCQEHGVESHLSEITIDFWAEKRGNVEDRARRERYRLLEKIARKCRIVSIATAHHRDDQVETVLMRILDRGTGLQGLGGIAEVSERGRYRYIRPLLPFSRKQLDCYMTGRSWVEDATNGSIDIRRNLFRHEVIPYLRRTITPDVDSHIVQLSDIASYQGEVLSFALDRFWDSHRRSTRSRSYLFSKEELTEYPDHFWVAALAHLLRRERGYTFGTRTLKDIIGFLRGEASDAFYPPLTIRKYKGEMLFKFS